MTMYERLRKSSDPRAQQLLEEWDTWLGEVADPHKRRWIEGRLKSNERAERLSARQELYFHHFFASRGWSIAWDPPIPGTSHTPEFLVQKKGQEVLIEARISQEERRFVDQEEFSERLQAELGKIPLPHRLTFSAETPTPPTRVFQQVVTQLSEYIGARFTELTESEARCRYRLPIQGTIYEFQFTFYKEQLGHTQGNLIVRYFSVGTATPGKKLYEDVEEKAARYGKQMDRPFVIAIWNLGFDSTFMTESALYGTHIVQWRRDMEGRAVSTPEDVVKPDGIFLEMRENAPKNAHISAVVTYSYKMRTNEHSLQVYHNPYAEHPLDEAVFNGSPQFVPTNDEMVWIPQDPKDE